MTDNEKESNRTATDSSKQTEANRRQVLRAVGGGALAGVGFAQASGTVSAQEEGSEPETERLSEKEAGQLRGEVMSSSAFKTVRQKIQDKDFWPNLGDGVTAAEVIPDVGEDSYEVFKTVCDYTGEDDEKTHNAILYAVKRNGDITVRSVCQHEGDSVFIHEMQCAADDTSGADEAELHEYEVSVSGGGE